MRLNTNHVVRLTDDVVLVFTHDVVAGEIVHILAINIGEPSWGGGSQS
jgi:hypothetical protein